MHVHLVPKEKLMAEAAIALLSPHERAALAWNDAEYERGSALRPFEYDHPIGN